MPEQLIPQQVPPMPRISQRPKRKLGWVWLIPLVSALVGLSIVYHTWSKQGPRIFITFQSAAGLEVGKTQIRFRDVVVGIVKDIRLTELRDRVIVEAELNKDSEGMANEATQFWVVKPRIGISGVSGLSTLMSGAYIETDTKHGALGKATKKQFIGLEDPPSITNDRPGSRFTLRTEDLGSLGVGVPVYMRRLQVGMVSSYKLDPTGQFIEVEVFVDAPYDRYVDGSTRFWNESGIDVSLSTEGMQINTQSLVSLISGGVSFGSFGAPRDIAEVNRVFKLYDNRRAAEIEPQGLAVPISMRFDQPTRGLKVGATVDFNGVDIGIVKSVALDFDIVLGRFFTTVHATLYPERLGAVYREMNMSRRSLEQLAESLALMTKRGLRAQLRSANILTGQLYIVLEDFPKAPKIEIPKAELPFKMPTLASDDLDKLQQQVANIVYKLDKIPFESIGNEVNDMIKQIKVLSTTLDKSVVPKLATTLTQIEVAVKNLNGLIAPGSAMTVSTEAMLEDLRTSLRSLRGLTDSLQLQPDSLITGRPPKPYSRETLGAPAK
jgi:paraquat-inducible protein B